VYFLQNHPDSLLHILMFSLTFSLGQCFIYALLAEHGSLVVSVVTTTRKFFSILISVLLFNPGLLGPRQWCGISFVFLSLGYDMIASHR
jgi:drug/metabolite transporter (DMT)-like permease